jgi:signal transduction histidine kinase
MRDISQQEEPTIPTLFEWFWALAGAVSVRAKILGIVLSMVLLLGVGITLQVRAVFHDSLVKRLEEQGISIARDLAARATDLILINDLYALHRLLVETKVNNPDVRYAFVADESGTVIAHTFGRGFPEDLLEANTVDPEAHHKTTTLDTDEGQVLDAAVPIFDGRAGMARVGMSQEGVQRTVSALTSQMLITTGLVSAVGIVAAALLTWIVSRPIMQLKRAAQAVGHGDFSQRVRPWAGDEIGELAEAFNVMTAELAQADLERAERDRLRTQLLERVITVQEEERQRIARELHDETGQALTSLMVRLRMMHQLCPTPELKSQVEDLRKLAARTLENIHALALNLRPSVLDDLGLSAALERYANDCRHRYTIDIDLAVYGVEEKRLPTAVETALYRIVQEGLTNIARHAQAKTASILIERHNGRVRAIIEDDGIGFDHDSANTKSQRLGLYGMRERTELLNGKFTIESEPGKGTSIYVEVPV